MKYHLNKKILFILGTYVAIGFLDGNPEQVISVEIYNPLDTNEEIKPLDPLTYQETEKENEGIEDKEIEKEEVEQSISLPNMYELEEGIRICK